MPPMYLEGNFPATPTRPPWNTAVQMLRKTTMRRVEARNQPCQRSESILVMMRTAMNRVAITVRDPIILTFSRNFWP